MRILQIAPPWFTVPPSGYGGAEQVVSLLTEGLIAQGHEVWLVAAGGSQTAGHLIPTFDSPPTRELGDPELELSHVLAGFAHRGEVDLIHNHTRLGLAVGAVVDGTPVVHTLHGRWTAATAELARRVSDRVHLVAISHDQAARTSAGIRLASTVHNAVDVAAHPYVAVKGEHLAYAGRAAAEKGPELAIEVARRLGRRLKMAIKVNQADEQDYFAAHIAPAIERGEVELVEVASHADKCALLGEAAAVLFPITWPEPFGLVPIEANACGTPVVAFAHGALPEVIEHGRNGLLVTPGDLAAFTDAAARAVTLAPADCRQVVLERFDAPRLVADYHRLYQRLLSHDTPPPDLSVVVTVRP